MNWRAVMNLGTVWLSVRACALRSFSCSTSKPLVEEKIVETLGVLVALELGISGDEDTWPPSVPPAATQHRGHSFICIKSESESWTP